jgi:hypothetical protein
MLWTCHRCPEEAKLQPWLLASTTPAPEGTDPAMTTPNRLCWSFLLSSLALVNSKWPWGYFHPRGRKHFPWWASRRPMIGTKTALHLHEGLSWLGQTSLPHPFSDYIKCSAYFVTQLWAPFCAVPWFCNIRSKKMFLSSGLFLPTFDLSLVEWAELTTQREDGWMAAATTPETTMAVVTQGHLESSREHLGQKWWWAEATETMRDVKNWRPWFLEEFQGVAKGPRVTDTIGLPPAEILGLVKGWGPQHTWPVSCDIHGCRVSKACVRAVILEGASCCGLLLYIVTAHWCPKQRTTKAAKCWG